jgi:hypothetical protein
MPVFEADIGTAEVDEEVVISRLFSVVPQLGS